MFGILRKTFYYRNTYGDPGNGYIRDMDTGEILKFVSVEKARQYIETDEYMPQTVQLSEREYRTDREIFSHGQYADDHFYIRQLPDRWLK